MSVVGVLREARARIERAWEQGDRNGAVQSNPEDGCCAATAFANLGDGDERWLARNRLLAAIGERSLVEWNDAPGRTQAEVLAAFDKAIQLAAADTSRDAAGMKR